MKNFNFEISKWAYISILCLFFICSKQHIFAVPAYPFPTEYTQPNGEVILIQMHGDEHFHYATTGNSFLVCMGKDNFFAYATISAEGNLVAGDVRVSKTILKSQEAELLKSDSKEFIEGLKKPALDRILLEKIESQQGEVSQRSSLKTSSKKIEGNMKSLVILANFIDEKITVSNPQQAFSNMLNQAGYSANGSTGSSRDYFLENSNGAFSPEFDVYGPIELPNEMAYYGENNAAGNDKRPQEMILHACQQAKLLYPGLNFKDYDTNGDGILDNVFVFYAGYSEAESNKTRPNTIWPHKSSLNYLNVKIDSTLLGSYACTAELRGSSATNMSNIGVFTHEFGHVLGLPDFYDTDGAVNGLGAGLGSWSIMDVGSYSNEARTPPAYSAVEKYALGWQDPILLSPQSETQNLSLNPSSNNSYMINCSDPREFFILEARGKAGWDTYLPAQGMLIYHIDTRTDKALYFIYKENENGLVDSFAVSPNLLWSVGQPNIVGNHQCMDLVRANNERGNLLYAGHPFPGSSNITTISDTTIPNILSWEKEFSNMKIYDIGQDKQGVVSFKLDKTNLSSIAQQNVDEPILLIDGKILRFTNINQTMQVEIYNVSGQKINNQSIQDNQSITIDKSGIYLVKTSGSQGSKAKKIIVM